MADAGVGELGADSGGESGNQSLRLRLHSPGARLAVSPIHLALTGEIVNIIPPIVHVAQNGNYIVQGKRVTDQETLGRMDMPDHETCVEVSRSAVAALVGS